MELPLAVQSYESRSAPFSAQRLLNAYIEGGSDGTKNTSILFGTPGTVDFADTAENKIRGMINMGSELYVVAGPDVYKISSIGSVTNIGTIGGTDDVDMARNETQIVIISNRSGFLVQSGTVSPITFPTFPNGTGGADSVTYIDGYFVLNDGPILFNSALGDGATYNALDFANAEYDPDTAIRVFADHSDLLVFGGSTIEVWYNAAASQFPFVPRRGTAMEVGLLSRDTVKKLDNSAFWFGTDDRGQRTVWRLNGYNPVRVSTHALEKKWDESTSPETAIALSYMQEGHAFYAITIPGTGTFVYDVVTGKWHERETFGDDDWRYRHYVTAYNKRLVGDSKTGKVMELDLDTFTEDGGIIEREIIAAPIADPDGLWNVHRFFRADIETGLGDVSGSDPQCGLSWSDEDGRVFNNEKTRSLGKIGEIRKRVFWRNLGRARSRIYRLRVTDAVKFACIGMYVSITRGRS